MRRTAMTRRWLMATAVAVALVAGACGNSDGGESASGDLPLLPGSTGSAAERSSGEASASGGADAAAAMAAPQVATDMSIAPGEPYRPVEYRLADDIDAMGGKQGAYRLEAAIDEDRVAKVAEALGVEGEPREENGTWTAGDTNKAGRFLVVDAQGSFSAYDGSADAVASSTAEARCSPDGACTSPPVQAPPPARDLPSDDEAVDEAREVLKAAGVDVGDDARVERSDYNVYVTFPVSVDGVDVEGLAHSVSFGDGGELQSASGLLAKPALVGNYPLVSTAEAYERWQGRVGIATGTAEPAIGGAEPAIAEDAPAPMPPESVPSEQTAPPTTLEPEIRELDTVDVVLLPEYGRCPGDAMYLVPGYRLSAGDEVYTVVPAVADEYLASAQEPAVAGADKAAEELEPCPGTEGESVPGREPDAPVSDGYPPITTE